MTIFALEVPHQRPPVCWTAKDTEDYVLKTIRWWTDWSFTEDPTFEDAVAYNASDRHAAYVYLSADEAAAALESGAIGNHQYEKAYRALLTEVMRYAHELTAPNRHFATGAHQPTDREITMSDQSASPEVRIVISGGRVQRVTIDGREVPNDVYDYDVDGMAYGDVEHDDDGVPCVVYSA